MMFNKDLFLLLCKKYGVELSGSAEEPMIKDEAGVHVIASKDIENIFTKCQTYFDYSTQKLQSDYAILEYDNGQPELATAC